MTLPVSAVATAIVVLVLPLKRVEGNFRRSELQCFACSRKTDIALQEVDGNRLFRRCIDSRRLRFAAFATDLGRSTLENVNSGQIPNYSTAGRCHIPVDIRRGVGAPVLWLGCCVDLLPLGMERSKAAHCTKSVQGPSWRVGLFADMRLVDSVHLQACHSYRCLHYDVHQVSEVLASQKDRVLPRVVSGMIFFSALYYLPQFFQVALAYSPIRSGIFLLPVLVSQTVASFVAVNICDFFQILCRLP